MMLENLNTGLALTVIGLGLVFLVLTLLAIVIWLMVRINDRLAEGGRQNTEHRTQNTGDRGQGTERGAVEMEGASVSGAQPDEVAAMLIAVRLHQIVRRRQAAPAMRTHQPGTLSSRWLTAGRTRQNRSWQRR